MIFLESFYHGYVIYPSNVQGAIQYPFTKSADYGPYGNNLLKAFVEEAKAYNIEVHAWVENFYVGYGTNILNSPILKENPSWAQVSFDGTVPQRVEANYLFMDPANQEVRQFLIKLYKEMIETTGVTNIHLDYIRYPIVDHCYINNNGFSDTANEIFKSLYGYEGDLRTLLTPTNALYHQVLRDWSSFKVNQITSFVEEVYHGIKQVNENANLSIAIYGDLNDAIEEKMQDWKHWIDSGWIEIIIPMAYYHNTDAVGTEIKRLMDIVGGRAFTYGGLATSYMGYNDHCNTLQIEQVFNSGTQGSSLFTSQFFLGKHNEFVQNILRQGIWRNRSILPHANINLIIERVFETIVDRADRLYLTNQVMNLYDLNVLKNEFKKIKTILLNKGLYAVLDEIKSLKADSYANDPAHLRIQEEMDYLSQLIEIRLRRVEIDQSIVK